MIIKVDYYELWKDLGAALIDTSPADKTAIETIRAAQALMRLRAKRAMN